MVDHEELLLDEILMPNTDREYGSYEEFIKGVAKEIPDQWDIQPLNKHDGATTFLYFSLEDKRIQEFMKYYIWKRLKRDRVGAITARSEHLYIRSFFDESSRRYPLTSWHDGYRQAWNDFALQLQERVREKMIPGSIAKDKLEVRSAKTYATVILKFIAETAGLYKQFSWAYNEDVSELLPDKLAEYFTPEERLNLRDEFSNLQYRHKTVVIPYDELLDIMLVVKKCDPTKHIIARASITIAMHTGLRISEIRRLNIDCLTPISEEEIGDAISFRENAKIDIGGVAPDWSNFYWLNYESAKDKKSGTNWSKGTPIMVSQTVHDAAVEVAEATKKLRKESGSERLFLVRGNRTGIASAGVTTLYKYKNDFLKEFGLPHMKFHQCRATFATILYDMDVPMEMIQKYLNHITIDITSGYVGSNLERDVKAMKTLMSNKILGTSGANSDLKAFHEQFLSAVDSEEWEYLSMTSQVSIFLFLQKKNNLTVSYGDHGFCMLKSGKTCPVSLEESSPCYQQQCEFYGAEREALPMFADILNNRKSVRDDYFSACIEYDEPTIAETKIAKFNRETQSLENLIIDFAKGDE